jgi:RNA ligase (TIGR02306 family)
MKLASVETITSLRPHPNADRLEIAQVLGWQCIVQKGIHKEGDKIIFVVIDTLVPPTPPFEFLADKNKSDKTIRIKMIKLRGEHSAGVIIPLQDLCLETTEIGTDVSQLLGVQKYVKELPANLMGESVGDFPTHMASKTDEDNGLSDLSLVKAVLEYDSVTITQKYDGSSITLIVQDGCLTQVCSRNLSKKDTETSVFWKAARKLNIPENWTGIIQGEMCGPGIQKNPAGLPAIEIFVFQIKTKIDNAERYLNYFEMAQFCRNQLKCNAVPLITKLNVQHSLALFEDPLKKLQELANKQVYPNSKPCEGIVVRPSAYPKSFSSRRPLGFKIINQNYND